MENNNYNGNSNYNGQDGGFIGKFGYRGSSQFAPLGAWGYFGYALLFSIPLVGLVCLIIFSVSDANINRRSFARSYLISLLIIVVLIVIAAVTGSLAALGAISRGYYYH